MKPAPFDYHAADSVAHALGLLQRLGDEARILAGGQSLGPMLNFRSARPSHLVDISRIAALKSIAARADGSIRLGACVTHAQIEDASLQSLPRDAGRYLRHVAQGIAYRAIRTRGTLAGSVANADPAADWPVALAAMEARIELSGPAGLRTASIAECVVGVFETVIAPGEMISAIEIPGPGSTAFGWGYRKETRKTGEFARALAACVHRGGPVAQVWLGAMQGRPIAIGVAIGTRDAMYARIHAGLTTVSDAYERHLHALTAANAIVDAIG